ncbi:hypothetical protein QBC47DRAFT_390595 [Echria macrotheca]|uniref:YMC020W-like alpha/beta hydrolase domain-containing protein n=1 Tax=Echria macrotheca TaxID=438768 RepID=A0AAJ0B5K2_9PEZI|nr:hypothetical protein QBC47DRAFT_390595 [Echria macrotheca]
MSPRKRAKPNPAEGSHPIPKPPTTMPSHVSDPSDSASIRSSQSPSIPINASGSSATSSTPQGTPQHSSLLSRSPAATEGANQVHKTRSWYGSWPRKSVASTQVARETILGGTVKSKTTADFSRFNTKKDPDSMSIDAPPASAPVLSGIREDGDGATIAAPEAAPQEPRDAPKPNDVDVKPADDIQTQAPAPEPPSDAPESSGVPSEATPKPPAASGWLGGWFGRPAATVPVVSDAMDVEPDEAKKPEEPTPDTSKPAAAEVAEAPKNQEPEQQVPAPAEPSTQPSVQERQPAATGGYWFGFWSSTTADPQPAAVATPEAEPGPNSTEETPPEAPGNQAKEPEDVAMQDAPPLDPGPAPQPKAGSTWAFWSRDTGSSSGKKTAQQTEGGQLAVIGESSESHPKRANSMEFKGSPTKEPPIKSDKDEQVKTPSTPSKEASTKKNKRARPLSMAGDEITDSRPTTPKPDSSKAESTSKAEPTPKAGSSKAPTSAKTSSPNLLLPSFGNTYRQKENPSIVKQIAQLILRTHQAPTKHVFLTKEHPKIKRAIAIGVHGLYPANYLRPMIGQPTGTSLKFANHCAEAIRRWADSHGCEDCEIEKVALEGEGKIGDRVENLWRLLLNWIDQIRKADLIVLSCHSQGVPVSIMLLAKLIELGIITTAKVGICAMAGVSLGPFPDYRSSMGRLMGTAAELWEFSDPESEVSKRLEASIKVVLAYGTRITYIGSMDDQLVPLESAIYAPAHHPYIYRAVFIDSRVHAPDFIAHLVGFALKLRNLGVSDHGLIRELSAPLAGSLYSGEGHSRLYDDEQVYDLAVTHALETTDVGNVECEVHKHQGVSNPNPYHLPWIMRGLLEEDFVRTELNSETAELLQQFDDWKPVTKALKDVKYRLEAVRSKL